MTNETKLPDEDALVEAMAQAIYDDPNEDFDCGAIANIAFDAIRPTLAALQARAEAVEAEEVRIDALRLKAFSSGSKEDRQRYFEAASKWFEDRHYRRMGARAALGDMP